MHARAQYAYAYKSLPWLVLPEKSFAELLIKGTKIPVPLSVFLYAVIAEVMSAKLSPKEVVAFKYG